MSFPVLLEMNEPKIYAYSIYSVIAEKFEAIVSLGLSNSRYKDFYDIYVLANKFEFDGSILKDAIKQTFAHRECGFNDIVAFESEFLEDDNVQKRWNAFIKKKKAIENIDFINCITILKKLLLPIVESIKHNTDFKMIWSFTKLMWN